MGKQVLKGDRNAFVEASFGEPLDRMTAPDEANWLTRLSCQYTMKNGLIVIILYERAKRAL